MSMLRILLVVAMLCGFGCSAPQDAAVTWLSTSSFKCPTEKVKRGTTAVCIASVDYLNASYVVPQADLNVRHDACTHASHTLCTVVAAIQTVDCSNILNATVCEYTIPFTAPALVSTGGVYTLSLTKKAGITPQGIKYPETLITQGVLTCGSSATSRLLGLVISIAVLSLGVW